MEGIERLRDETGETFAAEVSSSIVDGDDEALAANFEEAFRHEDPHLRCGVTLALAQCEPVGVGAGELDGRQLLVVDDEPPMRTALKRALELGGFDVTLAADGSEGLESAAGDPRRTRSCSTC